MKTRFAVQALSALALHFAFAAPAQAVTCTVGFDQNMHWFVDQARSGFAYPSTYVPTGSGTGHYTYCPQPWPNTTTNNCWMYWQFCTAGKGFSVFAQVKEFYYLAFDDPSITCMNSQGWWGRPNSSGGCTMANWGWEPRHLLAVGGSNNQPWLEIAQKDTSANYHLFKLKTLHVEGPIQLWYKKPDGSVWGWSNLPAVGAVNWSLQIDATIVWVGPGSSSGYYNVVDFTAETY